MKSRSLYIQVLLAIAAGVLFGIVAPSKAAAMKPLGDGFIKLIKMMIAPIIFCTVVLGIAGTKDLKKVGKTGGLALLYFEVVSTIALLIGLLLVNVIHPGAGMNVDASKLDTSAISAYTGPGKMQRAKDFLLNVIPNAFVDAFAKGDVLQVLLIAVLFGIALQRATAVRERLLTAISGICDVLFQIVKLIMLVAPIGAFGAMAFTVGSYGIHSLLSLAKLMGTFYATCVAFIFGV